MGFPATAVTSSDRTFVRCAAVVGPIAAILATGCLVIEDGDELGRQKWSRKAGTAKSAAEGAKNAIQNCFSVE